MNLEHHGRDVGVRHFRKHLGWYLDRHVPLYPGDLRARILTGLAPDAIAELVRQAFLDTENHGAAERAAA